MGREGRYGLLPHTCPFRPGFLIENDAVAVSFSPLNPRITARWTEQTEPNKFLAYALHITFPGRDPIQRRKQVIRSVSKQSQLSSTNQTLIITKELRPRSVHIPAVCRLKLMQIKTPILAFLATFLFLAFASAAFSQRPTTSMNRICADGVSQAIVQLQKAGDISYSPCPDRGNLFDRNVSFRKNNFDTYKYGFSFDSLSDYNGAGELTNAYTEFNLNLAPASGVFRNSYSIFNVTTPDYISAAIGMTAHLVKSGPGDVHDLQAIQGSTIVTSGRASSGIYGIIGNVGIFGGSNTATSRILA
jgi:hypothetical protein